MEGPIAAILFFVSVFGIVFALWTWVVVHQAATEAREYFRRENEAHHHATSRGKVPTP
jgi:hypothetical protein